MFNTLYFVIVWWSLPLCLSAVARPSGWVCRYVLMTSRTRNKFLQPAPSSYGTQAANTIWTTTNLRSDKCERDKLNNKDVFFIVFFLFPFVFCVVLNCLFMQVKQAKAVFFKCWDVCIDLSVQCCSSSSRAPLEHRRKCLSESENQKWKERKGNGKKSQGKFSQESWKYIRACSMTLFMSVLFFVFSVSFCFSLCLSRNFVLWLHASNMYFTILVQAPQLSSQVCSLTLKRSTVFRGWNWRPWRNWPSANVNRIQQK